MTCADCGAALRAVDLWATLGCARHCPGARCPSCHTALARAEGTHDGGLALDEVAFAGAGRIPPRPSMDAVKWSTYRAPRGKQLT